MKNLIKCCPSQYVRDGVYGSHETPCEVYIIEKGGGFWYCVQGSAMANFTYDDLLEDDVLNVETVNDVDCFTASPMNNIDDLEKYLNE